tara:strand:+ start:6786 stop:7334 length:549 start_codon:yes stop_codon:yes gene_type:complete
MTISRILVLSVLTLFFISGTTFAQHQMHSQSTPLTESGNDIFGAIQQVIKQLEENPNTDWSQVDLEALRQHLLDMKAFTEEVDVLSETPIDKGIEIHVKPQSDQAIKALTNVLSMHPSMLKSEQGWDMNAIQKDEYWVITCTTEKVDEVDKVRGLGYIGLLAAGAHHQLHHWMVATNHMGMN